MRRRKHDHWHRLATYNAECSRGIVHTDEYDALMRKEQAAYDRAHGGPFPRIDPYYLPDYKGTPG